LHSLAIGMRSAACVFPNGVRSMQPLRISDGFGSPHNCLKAKSVNDLILRTGETRRRDATTGNRFRMMASRLDPISERKEEDKVSQITYLITSMVLNRCLKSATVI
jgi:hypothetical protein